MIELLIFWSMIVAGYYIGYILRKKFNEISFPDTVILYCAVILVTIMGIRMGLSEKIVSVVNKIGITAIIFTLVFWIGGILGIIFMRKILKINRCGKRKNMDYSSNEELTYEYKKDKVTVNKKITIIIIVFAVVGFLLGNFLLRKTFTQITYTNFLNYTSWVINIGVSIILLMLGISLGFKGRVVEDIKKAGIIIVSMPFAMILGTALSAILIGILYNGLSVIETLSISFGFGWYTLTSAVISGAGFEVAGAIAFVHNILRELIGIILMPIIAKKVGYIEAVSMPGCCVLDIGLPVLIAATDKEMTAYAVMFTIVEEFFAMIVVPVIINL